MTNNREALKKQKSDLVWEGKFWGPGKGLDLAKKMYESSDKTRADKFAYASDLHAAAGRAATEVVRFGKFWYIPRCLSAAGQALQLVEETDIPTTRPFPNLDQIDVACAIWRRWGWLRGGRKKATRTILERVGWGRLHIVQEYRLHTRFFLVTHALAVGLGHKQEWETRLREMAVEGLHAFLEKGEGDKDQLGRMYRQIAQLYHDFSARQTAAGLSRADQRRKMGV